MNITHMAPSDAEGIPSEDTLFYKYLTTVYQYTLVTPKLSNDIARYLYLDRDNLITRATGKRLGDIWVDFFSDHIGPMMDTTHKH